MAMALIRFWVIALAVLTTSFTLATRTNAANFFCDYVTAEAPPNEFTNTPIRSYAVLLYGDIVDGDARRLAVFLDALSENNCQDFRGPVTDWIVNPGRHVIRLHSKGGTLTEALALGRLFRERYIRTEILAGQECLSACAVAFMFGYAMGFEGGGGGPNRILFAGGRLGFHRPYLAENTISISPEVLDVATADELSSLLNADVAASFDAANELIREMVAIDPFAWSPDLLVKMLTASGIGPNGKQVFISPETIGDLVEWNISYVPRLEPVLTNGALLQAVVNHCYNSETPEIRNLNNWTIEANLYSLSCVNRDCQTNEFILESGKSSWSYYPEELGLLRRVKWRGHEFGRITLKIEATMDPMTGSGCNVNVFDYGDGPMIEIGAQQWSWGSVHGLHPDAKLESGR